MCRSAAPDLGATRHGTPLEHMMCKQAPQHCAEHRLAALSGMQPDECQQRSVLYHLLALSLQKRTGRSPRPPCGDRN
jgi:hypothetical protein